MTITPQNVHETLSKYMLTDGMELVLDLKKSKGCKIYDSKSDTYFLDGFSFFASAPLGCNHPKLTTPEAIKELGELAVNNPTNSDLYTVEMAEFVDSFVHHAVPKEFAYLFFISGGALAIENALKTAFDWKVRKNIQKGLSDSLGSQIIHFKDAFHGRSGYTLSLTNTFNLNKTKYFTKFNWPRIINPKLTFPINDDNLSDVKEIEIQAVLEIENAVEKNPDDIAGLIIEPIQGEGGDNHFRKEFFITLRKLCTKHDMMFMLDEVQTGLGLTGKMWAYEHFDIVPDILAFGKKTQVCGIMVNKLVDEVKDNVFHTSSRINSTWGGNLIDMVRCKKYLEIIKEERLVENAKIQGEHLQKGLEEISEKYPELICNTRGRGLMCAFDLSTADYRDAFRKQAYKKKLIILGCGEKTIRFRPPLPITSDEIDKMLTIVEDVVNNL
ncbi:MAG: L-lysine 6-transaminase [Thermoplasmatota archaeon]